LGYRARLRRLCHWRAPRGGGEAAREVAIRIFAWGAFLGMALACVQWIVLPATTTMFSPLTAGGNITFTHLVNGLVFAGKGTMLGLDAFRDLVLITSLGVAVMI
jgi:hypothetical protein